MSADKEKDEYKRLTIDRVTNGFIVYAQTNENITHDSAIPYVATDAELTYIVCKLFFNGGKL